jgi:hypothetical protein
MLMLASLLALAVGVIPVAPPDTTGGLPAETVEVLRAAAKPEACLQLAANIVAGSQLFNTMDGDDWILVDEFYVDGSGNAVGYTPSAGPARACATWVKVVNNQFEYNCVNNYCLSSCVMAGYQHPTLPDTWVRFCCCPGLDCP